MPTEAATIGGGESMGFTAKAGRIFDRILDAGALLSGIIIIILMFAISEDVAARSLLGQGASWLIDTSTYLLLYMTFLGTAWVLRREGHVKMDVVLGQFSPRNQTLINIITSTLGIVSCLIVAFFSAKVTWEHFQLGYYMATGLEPAKYSILLVIPLGYFLLFVQFLRRTHGYLKSWTESREQRS